MLRLSTAQIHFAVWPVLRLSTARLGEANKLGTETEAGTLTSSNTNSGGEEVEHGEHNRSEHGQRADFTHIQLLLGDDDGGHSDGQTFNEILNNACDDIRNHTVHFIIPDAKKKKTQLHRIYLIPVKHLRSCQLTNNR